jgi:hypothetical protein
MRRKALKKEDENGDQGKKECEKAQEATKGEKVKEEIRN